MLIKRKFLFLFLPIAAHCMDIPIHNLDWQKDWDFKARKLELDKGFASYVGAVVQPRIKRLDFFGSLGFFPAGEERFVGFALIKSAFNFTAPPVEAFAEIVFLVESHYPSLVYTLQIEDAELQNKVSKGLLGQGTTFQAKFSPANFVQSSDGKRKISLKAQDFKLFRRGALVTDQSLTIDLSRLKSLGFLITRSRQTASQKVLPFELLISRISLK